MRGISLLPELAVEADRGRGRVYRPLAEKHAQRMLVVFHHRVHHRGRLVDGMLRIVEESAAELASESRDAPKSSRDSRGGDRKVPSRSG